jgi:hypothetical protein
MNQREAPRVARGSHPNALTGFGRSRHLRNPDQLRRGERYRGFGSDRQLGTITRALLGSGSGDMYDRATVPSISQGIQAMGPNRRAQERSARAVEAAKRAEAERKAIAKEVFADFEVSDIEQIHSDCGRTIS